MAPDYAKYPFQKKLHYGIPHIFSSKPSQLMTIDHVTPKYNAISSLNGGHNFQKKGMMLKSCLKK
jgi:hypothetical protein